MEFSREELEIESLGCLPSDICLSSSAVECEVCKTGTVVRVGREASMVIYTRNGTVTAKHEEKRCNNRTLPCRAGHYYGYTRTGQTKVLDQDVLRGEFLVTSSQTAFSIDYLWDLTLQILFSRATFEGLGNIYNNLHFTHLPFDTLQKRENIISKRIAEAFYMYAYVELGQRYDIQMTIPSTLEDSILENKSNLHEFFRHNWTRKHRCDIAGCGSILTMDGGCKPHRKLCASKLAGVREFRSTGIKVVTGCTGIPAPRSKFCKEHQTSQSPALLSSQVTKDTRMTLRDHNTATAKSLDAQQDNIFVIETILDVEIKAEVKNFRVKWLNFPENEATWEPEESIPKFIQLYFNEKSRYGKPLPNPKLKRVKRAGTDVYHLLTWEGDSSAGEWLHDDFFKLLGDDGEIFSTNEDDQTCNTRKSRDKVRLHTWRLGDFKAKQQYLLSSTLACFLLIMLYKGDCLF